MDGLITNGKVLRTMSVKDAAALVGMTPGGLRGAILRGKIHAEKDDEGRLQIRSHDLAAFHICGDGRHYPQESMTPTRRVALHRYLEAMVDAG
jgi:hypothetical protein